MCSVQLEDAVAAISSGTQLLEEIDIGSLEPGARLDLLRQVERACRRLDAASVGIVDRIDIGGFGAQDGFLSTRAMVRYAGQLSDRVAGDRLRCARALRDLPAVAAAWAAGDIGSCQVRRLARAWSNPRVRDQLPEFEELLLGYATAEQYKWFALLVTEWERRADPDGTLSRDAITPEARLTRNDDGTWTITGHLDSATGVAIDEIFTHYLRAEEQADWDKARVEHGGGATWSDLPRTDPERRAAAFVALCFDGAATAPGGKEPRFLLNLVMTWEQYLAELDRLADPLDPLDPLDAADPADRGDLDSSSAPTAAPPDLPPGVPPAGHPATGHPATGHPATGHDRHFARCGTLSGTPIDPWDAARLSLGADIRRVVVRADGAVIDLGTKARFFTGSARDAVMMRNPECVWAGCHQPHHRCQADHLQPYGAGGATASTNGAPLCGPHNRLKSLGYRVWCDSQGRWHTLRPDGSEV